MDQTVPIKIKVAVEGVSDTELALKILSACGFTIDHQPRILHGAGNLDKVIPKLAKTTIYDPWVALRDADRECPVSLREHLIGNQPHDGAFELRIPQGMTESWLLADAPSAATWLHVSESVIPREPDLLPHAKKELLRIAKKSRSRRIREDLVTSDGRPGPLYESMVNNFAREHWNVLRACKHSPSLDRSVIRLQNMRAQIEEVLS